jgi:hypothetical protein
MACFCKWIGSLYPKLKMPKGVVNKTGQDGFFPTVTLLSPKISQQINLITDG